MITALFAYTETFAAETGEHAGGDAFVLTSALAVQIITGPTGRRSAVFELAALTALAFAVFFACLTHAIDAEVGPALKAFGARATVNGSACSGLANKALAPSIVTTLRAVTASVRADRHTAVADTPINCASINCAPAIARFTTGTARCCGARCRTAAAYSPHPVSVLRREWAANERRGQRQNEERNEAEASHILLLFHHWPAKAAPVGEIEA